jgi:hypothetical protein
VAIGFGSHKPSSGQKSRSRLNNLKTTFLNTTNNWCTLYDRIAKAAHPAWSLYALAISILRCILLTCFARVRVGFHFYAQRRRSTIELSLETNSRNIRLFLYCFVIFSFWFHTITSTAGLLARDVCCTLLHAMDDAITFINYNDRRRDDTVKLFKNARSPMHYYRTRRHLAFAF